MITVTAQAAAQVKKQIEKRGEGLGIRVLIKNSGCFGLYYKLQFVDDPEPTDILIESHGSKIYIDAASVDYIKGTTIDFVRDGLNEGFEFINPNEVETCGCGKSFHV